MLKKDSTRVLLTVPREIRQWLESEARYTGSTMSAEACRAIRERMEREGISAGKDRAIAAMQE